MSLCKILMLPGPVLPIGFMVHVTWVSSGLVWSGLVCVPVSTITNRRPTPCDKQIDG